MKRNWTQILIFVFLIGLVIWAGQGIFKYDIFATHDLKHHVARGFDAIMAAREGHFPLRWAGLMNFECGVPIFNFYYPLLYYLMIIVNVFTGGILMSLKIVNFLALLLGTLFFYLWMKEETENPWASFASAILYLYAPYRFLLVYVRGSPEYLSYAIIPIVLYFFARVFKAKKQSEFILNSFLAALSGGILIISHNIVALFLMPLIFVYLITKFIQNKNLSRPRIFTILFSYLSAFGLGAFFIFPALLEEKFTNIATPLFNYRDHFPTLSQVLHSAWGYGDSAVGSELDAMSFQLGYAHWVVMGIVATWLVFVIIKSIYTKKYNEIFLRHTIFIWIFFALSLLFLFLVLPISLPVWERITILQTIQFPWRLLGICVFTVSALFGFWVSTFKRKVLYWVILIGIVLLALIGNRNHLLPNPIIESDLPFYLSLDKLNYPRRMLPDFVGEVFSTESSLSCNPTTPIVSTNVDKEKITYEEVQRSGVSGQVRLTIDKKNIQGDKIILNLSYFPDIYRFKVEGEKINYINCGSRVCLKMIDLRDGSNLVEWKVGQTGIEKIFNFVSLAFLTVWVCINISIFRKNDNK